MVGLCRVALLCLLAVTSLCCVAGESAGVVARKEIDAHVCAQYEVFGPRSKQTEYFGYVYSHDGVLASAVVRGSQCVSARVCGVDTAAAARLIPQNARVLGEWHTHPHRGSSLLSTEDVRGAHNN